MDKHLNEPEVDGQKASTETGTQATGAQLPKGNREAWDSFVTDEELQAFAQATEQTKAATYEQRTQGIFRQNGALAAAEICNLALGAANERVRLDASKYVVDRVLGRVSESKALEAEGAPWEGVFGAIVREPTAAERAAGKDVTRDRE